MNAECAHPVDAVEVTTTPRSHGNRLASLLKTILRHLRHQVVFNEINDLDDHQLADIGLVRDDLRHARDLPVLSDRVGHLVAMRRDPLRGTRQR